ncbi:MAG TPA: cyclic peptide export ABC transporter [Candidatus Acidoferrales bacterium]|nr:cyclic peptide export ABC transporter [Candidatus Acidoferrales bacterium]
MTLFSFLLRGNVRQFLIIAALSILSGAGSAGLIAAVNGSLQIDPAHPTPKFLLAVALGVALIAKIGGSLGSSLLLGRLAQKSILDLCGGLCRKIASTPFRELERLGPARVLTCLTEDVSVLSGATQAIPLLLINPVVLAGCVLYLAHLSWIAVVVLTLVMGVAALCYRLIAAKGYTAIRNARIGKETMFRHFRSLVDGIKELKIHRGRREAFFREELDASTEYYRSQNLLALNRYALADGWSQMMFGFLIATLVFLLPAFGLISPQDLIKYVVVAIYAMSPAWNLIRAIPTLATGRASLERMHELGFTLDALGRDADDSPEHNEIVSRPPLIELRGAVFSYSDNSARGFTLGPLDLTLNPGELLFVIGGNGSGKSSFVKLLTGLYTADSGEIRIDGRPVSTQDLEEYRRLFSVVYSDFYLFDRLLGISEGSLREKAARYVAALDLAHKVELKGDSLSTINLSQGQRRRLALLSAYMEDRPVYVLDEWAADQDPIFRDVFYLKLLPELKARGKTVVVVTHDDRYFHLGDRIVKLDRGKVATQPLPSPVLT